MAKYFEILTPSIGGGVLGNGIACQVYLYLAELSAETPTTVFYRGEKVHLDVGEVVTSRKQIAMDLNHGEQKIRTALNLLQGDSLIEIRPSRRYSIIRLCGYIPHF